MSTAYFPSNMRIYSSNGYAARSTSNCMAYATPKGSGLFRNPVANLPGRVRPLTNNDPGYNWEAPHGLPRPIKHYRRGRVFPITSQDLARDFNLNRFDPNSAVPESRIRYTQDTPGAYSVQNNDQPDCAHNLGSLHFNTDFQPSSNLTDNPTGLTCSKLLCCNAERKARRRVLAATSVLSPNYFSTTHQRLYNRCQTYEQRQFNFASAPTLAELQSSPETSQIKPGDPLSLPFQYVAQCTPRYLIEAAESTAWVDTVTKSLYARGKITLNDLSSIQTAAPKSLAELAQLIPEESRNELLASGVPLGGGTQSAVSCGRVIYKPNNPQFAIQGAVSSSTRTFKLNVDTITKAAGVPAPDLYGSYIKSKTDNVGVAPRGCCRPKGLIY